MVNNTDKFVANEVAMSGMDTGANDQITGGTDMTGMHHARQLASMDMGGMQMYM
jgi:hypothetical protein